jgi:hypothetical protein
MDIYFYLCRGKSISYHQVAYILDVGVDPTICGLTLMSHMLHATVLHEILALCHDIRVSQFPYPSNIYIHSCLTLVCFSIDRIVKESN